MADCKACVGVGVLWKRHPGCINGAGAHFALLRAMPKQLSCPKHFLMTVCLQGQARDPRRQWTPWSSKPEENYGPRVGTLIEPVGIFKKTSQKEMLSDVMNINKRPLIVSMTGPWEWGLEKMRLKRPCRSFLKGVTLLDLDGKEVGSCSGSSDSLCLCFKIWLLGCKNSQHLPQPSLWRPRVGVDENVSPHGADLISRQPSLPYSSGLLFALPVTCIGAHAQLLGRPGSSCRV